MAAQAQHQSQPPHPPWLSAPDPSADPGSLADDEPVELRALEKLSIKEATYRQALLQAWFGTALEQTRSIFTLASAGVSSATLIFGDLVKSIESWAPIWLLMSMVAFSCASFPSWFSASMDGW